MDRSDPNVFARNLRAFRTLRGMSLNELAERAGVSKRTLIRIEKGQGCTARIEHQIGVALSTPSRRLWDAEIISLEPQKLITAETGRWAFFDRLDTISYFRRLERSEDSSSEEFCSDPDAIQNEAERNRLGSSGLAHGFSKPVGGSISCGYFSVGFMEFYKSVNMIHAITHIPYFYYVLRGAIKYERESFLQEVPEGEGIVCHPNERYVIAPLQPVKQGEQPPLVLYTMQHVFPLDRVRTIVK